MKALSIGSLILGLLLFPFTGCKDPGAGLQSGAPAPKWPSSPLVAVATFDNPGHSKEGKHAWEVLNRVLDENRIRAVGAGSGGATLNVQETDAEKARKLITDAIKKWQVKAQVLADNL